MEKLYTEEQMRQCFLAGFKQAYDDPVRCRPSEFIATLPTVQAPVVPSAGELREVIFEAYHNTEAHREGDWMDRLSKAIRAHLLAHGYREQSEGGGKHVGWTDGMNVWGRFKVSDEYAKAKEWEAVYTRSTPPPSNSAVREAVEILQGLSAWLVRNPTPTETLTLQRAIVDALAALEVKP